MRIKLARTWWARVRGMLFESHPDFVLALVPCCDIHTFGMRFSLDVAFVDRWGLVVASKRDLERGKRMRVVDGYAVLERRADREDAWFQPGDYIGDELKSFLAKGKNNENLSYLPVTLL